MEFNSINEILLRKYLLPLWAWLVIAIAVIVLIIVVVVILCKKNKKPATSPVEESKKEAQNEAAEEQQTEEETAPAAETAGPAEKIEEEKQVTKPVENKAAKPAEKKAAKPVEQKAEAKPVEKKAEDKKSASKTYHISMRKADGMWQVKAAGGAKAVKLFKTQQEAIDFCKPLALNQDANIVIHKKDGSFRKLTY